MTDWGVHLIDYILYGMGKSIPESVMAIGGKYAFPDDAMVTPDTMTAVYDFKDFTMIWEHTIGIGSGKLVQTSRNVIYWRERNPYPRP